MTQTQTLSNAPFHPSYAPELAVIRDQQQGAWNRFSPGWRKWDDFTMRFLDEQGAAIVEALGVRRHHQVLDVAAGTGEPGLTLASLVSEGTVTGVDVAEGMLEVARDKARARGLDNYVAVAGDACALQFADASFDAVSCRLGFMFFPDVALAAREMLRVLRPGGTFAATVWGSPADNRWITTLVGAIKDNLDMPAAPAGAPGMFRCAEPGHLASVLAHAGFEVTRDEPVVGTMRCRTVDEYWTFMNDVVPPVVAVLEGASEATVEAVRRQVADRLGGEGPADLPVGAYLVRARKPG